jgi:hypothetical protein
VLFARQLPIFARRPKNSIAWKSSTTLGRAKQPAAIVHRLILKPNDVLSTHPFDTYRELLGRFESVMLSRT